MVPSAEHVRFLVDEIASCEQLRLHALELEEGSSAIIYEALLLRAFRVYENFVERLFFSVLSGEPLVNGATIDSCVSPRDESHARKLVGSAAATRFLDWSEPKTVRERCDIFLEAENSLGLAIGGKTTEITWMRKVRNHVAHNSVESASQFSGVLQTVLLTIPESLPSPGIFLRQIPKKGPVKDREVLAFFLDAVLECAKVAAGQDT